MPIRRERESVAGQRVNGRREGVGFLLRFANLVNGPVAAPKRAHGVDPVLAASAARGASAVITA